MNTYPKKIALFVTLVGLIGSQIACAGKMQQVRGPIDQANLPKDYTYTVKLKTQEKIRGLQADDIKQSGGQLVLKTAVESKTVMSQNVEYVYGQANLATETHTTGGLIIGASVGTFIFGSAGAFLSLLRNVGEAFCEDHCDRYENQNFFEHNREMIIGAGIGAFFGGMTGAIIGSRPQKKQIFIFDDKKNIQQVRKVKSGNKAISGLIIGGAAGGIAGQVATMSGLCEDQCSSMIQTSFIGAVGGGLVGLGIGALIPAYQNVEITPTISPNRKGGVDAGVNVGFKF
jgi:hypothetical protein